MNGDLHKRPILMNRNRDTEDVDIYESKAAKEMYIHECRRMQMYADECWHKRSTSMNAGKRDLHP